MYKTTLLAFAVFVMFNLSGCLGTIVGTTVDVAVEAAKVPFKVGGAVVDVATGSDDEE